MNDFDTALTGINILRDSQALEKHLIQTPNKPNDHSLSQIENSHV